ncbi:MULTISPECIES: glutathione S-transferase family protein [Sphingobium]|uniref:Glutathione S-transferase family protein n=1 Tax=Sphingobium cupriresistens TaxID=1132417 RepID=A0A8G2DX89_9SPHN|nr:MULTISPECIES: glutathione S-transferase family protein [Sphingobium]MBJ7378609.1 glutathione S-transferase family protein [Sphingobium sp.]RYM09656.1 glutathione S-transferase family protein [Sphingobium cupriresistens]WCP15098.1 Glutathione S-transferase GstB [Sphingobium sp. AntQ-1]
MLTIWGRLNSHNVKKVAWFADEIGLPYVRHDVGGAFGMSADYLAKNPNALIPTIEDGDVMLWESNAILRYLAARYALGLWPANPAERAQGDKWMDWQFAFADAQRDAFLQLVRRTPEQRDGQLLATSAAASGAAMKILDRTLAVQPWLSGVAFGVADVPMGVYAHTFFTLDMERPDVPHVRGWYDRLRTRPAYAQSVMIPLT